MLVCHDQATYDAVPGADELPTVGETIGGYRLDRLNATGGTGALFAAVHTRLGRRAAVQVLHPRLAADGSYVSRLLQEARTVNELRHPNIVAIYDFIETETGRVAFAMEHLDGPTLSNALVRRGRFSVVQALNATRQLLDALAAVHTAGVMHRDLKPDNIVVTAPVDSELRDVPSVKILGFGINDAGTPAYAAPEQLAGMDVSPAADVYAVAEILFELAAGRRLFEGEDRRILTHKLKHHAPRFDISEDIDAADQIVSLTRTAIAPDPRRRPSTTDLRRAVEDLLEDVGLTSSEPSGLVDDGAATILSLEAPRFDRLEDDVETDDDMKPVDESFDTGMNTQMFFDRISEDIADVHEPEVPPPAAAPEPMPSLQMPPRAVSFTEHSPLPRSPTGRPPVIRGTPARPPSIAQRPGPRRPAPARAAPPRRRFLWLVLAPALLAIPVVALPGLRDRARTTLERAVGRVPNPVRSHLAAWRERHPNVSGTADEHFAEARIAHAKDEWASYRRAEAELEKALILDPDHARSIGLYVENTLLWKEHLLTDAEGAELTAFVEVLLAQADAPPALLRAEALLAKSRGDIARCRAKAQAAQAGTAARDALALLIEAECTLAEDGARAESLIWSATETERLGRAPRIRAAALARAGRYRDALHTLEERLATVPKNGRALLAAAQILHAVGEHAAELDHLSRATRADGAQLLAQLRLGETQAELGRADAATKTLNALADNVHAPPHLRRAACVAQARLALLGGRQNEAAEQLRKAARLEGDPIPPALALEVRLAGGEAEGVISGAPFPPGTERVIAAAQILSGRPDEAKHILEKLIASRPRDARVHVHLAAARALLDDFNGARRALDQAAAVDLLAQTSSDDVAARLIAPRLEALRGSASDRAVVDATSALLAYYSGDRQRARERCAEAADAENAPLAAVILEMHLTENARRRLTLAKRLDAEANGQPGAAVHLAIARAESARGRTREAIEAYGRALEVDGALLSAQVERAEAKAKHAPKKALESLTALHLSNPGSARLRRALYVLQR